MQVDKTLSKHQSELVFYHHTDVLGAPAIYYYFLIIFTPRLRSCPASRETMLKSNLFETRPPYPINCQLTPRARYKPAPHFAFSPQLCYRSSPHFCHRATEAASGGRRRRPSSGQESSSVSKLWSPPPSFANPGCFNSSVAHSTTLTTSLSKDGATEVMTSPMRTEVGDQNPKADDNS